MDAFGDPRIRRVVVMSSAQVGKTTVLENVIGYHAQHDPCPVLVVFPTLEIGEAFSKDRLGPMIRDTPSLRNLFAPEGSRSAGNTLRHKKFVGGALTIGGANSPPSLSSRTIRLLLCDEVDRFPLSAGEEGDPVRLAEKRTATYWNRRIGHFSTPTGDRSRIALLYADSDQRLYEMPCPHCGDRFAWRWEHLRWDEADPILGADGSRVRRARDAWFECGLCNARINEVQRLAAIRMGSWRATQPGADTAGFWLWQGISPFVSALSTANEWLGAQGKPLMEKTVMNTVRGEVYRETGDKPDWERLKSRSAGERGVVAARASIVTAGVDVQRDRLEMSVWAWGRGKERWLVDHLVYSGDTASREPWDALRADLLAQWRHESGASMRIAAACIDAQYQTQAVYDFCRTNASAWLPTHGRDSGQALVWQGNTVDFRADGQRVKRSLRPWLMNSSMAKSELYAMLRVDLPDNGEPLAGAVHFVPMPDEYYRQLTSEALVERQNKAGFRVMEWVKQRERNEALDCANLARAAAAYVGIDRFTAERWAQWESGIGGVSVADPATGERSGGWLAGGGWLRRNE